MGTASRPDRNPAKTLFHPMSRRRRVPPKMSLNTAEPNSELKRQNMVTRMLQWAFVREVMSRSSHCGKAIPVNFHVVHDGRRLCFLVFLVLVAIIFLVIFTIFVVVCGILFVAFAVLLVIFAVLLVIFAVRFISLV